MDLGGRDWCGYCGDCYHDCEGCSDPICQMTLGSVQDPLVGDELANAE
jgi:hypothetical protein